MLLSLIPGVQQSDIVTNNMAVVAPWGRFEPIRKDLLAATKTEAEGGTGKAAKFWEWSEEQVREYL